MVNPVSVGFVLLSNSRAAQPSTRISVLNMFSHLKGAGYDPKILFEPEVGDPEPDIPQLVDLAQQQAIKIVYFQKVHGARVVAAAKELSLLGVRTVYGVCDFVDNEMAQVTDVTIVVTEFLKSLYRSDLHPKIHVVHDGIERPELRRTRWSADWGSTRKPLRAVLVTSSPLDHIPMIARVPPFVRIVIIGHYPSRWDLLGRVNWARWTFAKKTSATEREAFIRFLLKRRITRVPWGPESCYELMCDADIGIIPVDMVDDDPVPGSTASWWQVKSENRLTMKMCIGLPVIASPVPSYLPVIEQGRNGYIAVTTEDWAACLETLRDPRTRKEVGERARDSVIGRFSQEAQAARLIDIFNRLARDN